MNQPGDGRSLKAQQELPALASLTSPEGLLEAAFSGQKEEYLDTDHNTNVKILLLHTQSSYWTAGEAGEEQEAVLINILINLLICSQFTAICCLSATPRTTMLQQVKSHFGGCIDASVLITSKPIYTFQMSYF